MIDCVVAPVDHKYEVPLLAFNTTLAPEQSMVEPLGVIVAVGFAATATVCGADTAEQLPFDTVTTYEPAALTVIDFVVAPFDQRYEVPVLLVNVTLPP